ncbi:response regulator [Marinobacter sp. X15-166B]|uniref:ATP-binding response regulator n=1 Tax=Marinobacter sp. X15-166B TaxID=1897620 RepID=UPI00085CB9D9|nr:response regulator [Marinobacter sp. X15-166B]OEY66965.1 hybrid sensor histidine kinase/response regulator [Marinobacter sp. X15-166B]
MTEDICVDSEGTVLLVDDNPQNLKVLYETLKDKGYRLLIANDGHKALSLALRDQPEVILLDIMMPELDGYEVCERLKADPQTADSAVVFLSALDEIDAKIKGFSLGGADYISKPFQAAEVIARVRTHARVVRLERELQQRNRQLQGDQSRILNAISEGIYGLDDASNIIFANPAAEQIAGGRADQLIGRNFFELHCNCAGSDSGSAGDPTSLVCQPGEYDHRRGVMMYRLDGSVFEAEYRLTPKYEGEELVGAVVVFRDITTELENERALEAARDLVQEQRDQLAQASRLSTLGEWAAGFAHEVNQPLTAITNYARVATRVLAADTVDKSLLQETLGKIEAQSHRASEVIRRIRRFVKQPASGKSRVSVETLLDDISQFAEVDIRHNNGRLVVNIADDIPDVLADAVQVQQVALNLIRNALEATRSAGVEAPVVVSAFVVRPGYVRFDVTDKGIGLPEDAEENLFLPFYTTKEDGMGIGLPMCRSLIQTQGGEIGFERPAEQGTRFFFTLPVAGAETG